MPRKDKSQKTIFCLVVIFLLAHFDFDSNALAESKISYLELFQRQHYADLINALTKKKSSALEPDERYLLLKAYQKTGDYLGSMQHLAELENQLPSNLREIFVFEKLNLYRNVGNYEMVLKTVADAGDLLSNRYLLDFVSDLVIESGDQVSDKTILQQPIDSLLPALSGSKNGPGILRLYAKTLAENDPRLRNVMVELWKVENFQALSTTEKLVVKLIKARSREYAFDILEHFTNQRAYKNYTYLSAEIPYYLSQLGAYNDQVVKDLRWLYLDSLLKRRQYSYLIDLLEKKEERANLGLGAYDAMSIQFDLYLRKGDPGSGIAVLKRMIKQYPTETLDPKYLQLANYYFQKGNFARALYFYDRLKPFKADLYDIYDVQWKIWRSHYLMGNHHELQRIAEWAETHEFKNAEMGARFCYWGYKLNLYAKGDVRQCYERYPMTYYGLHARFSQPEPIETVGVMLPPNSILQEVSDISEERKAILEFLKAVYLVGETDLADSVVRSLLPSADSRLKIALARLLLDMERYYLVQVIVESNFRSLFETSDKSRQLLLPFFYPLAFEDELNRLEDKELAPKTLILSVMREESHFNPQVRSVAGAVGLMQLMPATATYIGKTIGMSVKIDSLMDPETNLTLGSAYLKRLVKRYQGNLFYTLAAYNGGPTNVNRWIKKTKTDDMDDFVETITYKETQNYVRRVMRSYYIYRSFYDI